ncbi:hypothetical protein RFI_38088, partial [Reticulomyxa filosa]
MKASLVLIAVHVLNAFLVISNAANLNIFNSSKDVTNGQTSQQYVHIGNTIEYISKLLHQRVDIENMEICMCKFQQVVDGIRKRKYTFSTEQTVDQYKTVQEYFIYQNTGREYIPINFSYFVNFFQIGIQIIKDQMKKKICTEKKVDLRIARDNKCIVLAAGEFEVMTRTSSSNEMHELCPKSKSSIGLELSFDNSLHNVGSNTKFNYQHQLQIYFSGVSMFNVNDIPFQMIENSDIKSKIMSLISTIRLQFYNAVQFCN